MSEPVILLHGLGQTRFTMQRLAAELRRRGRETVNLVYPSLRGDIRWLADLVWRRIGEKYPGREGSFDFVTHSMGGIVLRQIAADHPGVVRRAVMIAPPNQGSELVPVMRRFRLTRLLIGPAGLEMGCEPGSVPNSLGAPDFECGVIAGSKPDNPFSRFAIPGPEDGRVSVANTRLEGMACHIVYPYGHLFLPARPEVIEQVENFLEQGQFDAKTR